VNSFIPPLHLLLLLGSSERFLTFALCNCVCSLALSGEFSLYPSATLLLPLGSHRRILCISLFFYSCASALSSSPGRFPTAPPPSAFAPPQTILCILSTMPRERGKSRRGSLYYNALSRRGRLTPSQLALIASRTTGPRHNSQGSSEPPSSPPHSIHGNRPVKEEMPPSRERTPFSLILLPPPPENQSTGPGVWRCQLHGGGGNPPKLAGGGAHDERW
jgi:hypothetical protein